MGSKVPIFIVAIGIVFSLPILILSMIVAFGKHYRVTESYWELAEEPIADFPYGIPSDKLRNLEPAKIPRPIKAIPLKPVTVEKEDFDKEETTDEEKPKARKLFPYKYFKRDIKDEISDGKLFTRSGFGVMMVDIVFLAATIFVHCGGTVPINKKITMCITSVIALASTIAGVVMYALALHHFREVEISKSMRTKEFQYTKKLYESVKSAKKMVLACLILTAFAIVIGLAAVLAICFMVEGSKEKSIDDQDPTDMQEVANQ